MHHTRFGGQCLSWVKTGPRDEVCVASGLPRTADICRRGPQPVEVDRMPNDRIECSTGECEHRINPVFPTAVSVLRYQNKYTRKAGSSALTTLGFFTRVVDGFLNIAPHAQASSMMCLRSALPRRKRYQDFIQGLTTAPQFAI